MRIDILTLFPEMCEAVMGESIIGRARKAGFVEVECHNFRDYAFNNQKRVDDATYGGGKGMLLQAEPIYQCYDAVCKKINAKPHVVYMSPQGRVLNQQIALEYSKMDNIMILCGHYEGVDERLLEEIVDSEISIGDYVMTGGELPALVFADTVLRLCEGVLDSEECFTEESHFSGLLEYPQYTRPPVWHGREVPEILKSGHHANIAKWRLERAIERTKEKRPDMYEAYIKNQEGKSHEKL